MEARDSPATATMEDGRPVELAPYRWRAEGRQERAALICEPPGFQGWMGEQGPSLG